MSLNLPAPRPIVPAVRWFVMLTADNLIPKPVQIPKGRMVIGWRPEDLEPELIPPEKKITLTQTVINHMKRNSHASFCGRDFPEMDQRAGCYILRRLERRGLVEETERKHTTCNGGRPSTYFRWVK